MGPHLRRLMQHAVGHDLEIPARLRRQAAEDDAVEHAEGMIGDNHQGTRCLDRRARIAIEPHIEFQGIDRILPEQLMGPRQPGMLFIEAADARLAGGEFQQPDDALPETPQFSGGIAKSRRRQRAIDRFIECGCARHAPYIGAPGSRFMAVRLR